MRFLIIHETRHELIVEAASQREAEEEAARMPYERWQRATTVREECVPIEEDPRNPFAGG
ncbi:MAG: hypothetical protein EXR48_07560 [Dehalococcoidia bacterium]|nr:hypothetical protein [Dehalococcoidia bacterium]